MKTMRPLTLQLVIAESGLAGLLACEGLADGAGLAGGWKVWAGGGFEATRPILCS